ncbi:2-dehydro-3-deoxygluconokinase [Neisseria perflava]|nr:2-dehydro-3-deoxygluconokinase [Neisseria perflava]
MNTATYLARTAQPERIEVRYVSAMGTDKLSSRMIERWREDGINTDWVLLAENRQPGLYLVQLDAEGERTFLYWRDQSAARYLLRHPDYPQVLAGLQDMDMVYLSGISLAILPEEDRFLLLQQLADLAAKGVEIAFDSNYRASLWESLAHTRDIYTRLMPLVSLALVTFEDDQAVWQDADENATITRLRQNGVKNIVVKSGKRGAVFSNDKGVYCHVPTTPVAHVVDTSAAGDSFNAGFLNGYLQGKDWETCCRQGNQLAGVVIRHRAPLSTERQPLLFGMRSAESSVKSRPSEITPVSDGLIYLKLLKGAFQTVS